MSRFFSGKHLDEFRLINMNGRMYDPRLARFLSPEPYVQAPNYSQSYNRYSYVWNNPLRYTDPDGEWVLPVIGFLIGAYIGGVATNNGELNPRQWDTKDSNTWLGIAFGGIMGAAGGYWIQDPSSFTLLAGVSTPYGQVALGMTGIASATGAGTDWKYNFQWTTNFGGGGDINLNQPTNISDIISGSNRRVMIPDLRISSYWDGNFFHGTGNEAQELLLLSSMFFGVETSYWFTSKGYYFSPIRGNAYKATDMFGDGDWNMSIGYRENSISRTWRYEQIYKPDDDNLYIFNPILRNISRHGFAKVYYRAHTHPGNRPPGIADMNHSFFLGYLGKVFGWNGVIYSYRGQYYIDILDD